MSGMVLYQSDGTRKGLTFIANNVIRLIVCRFGFTSIRLCFVISDHFKHNLSQLYHKMVFWNRLYIFHHSWVQGWFLIALQKKKNGMQEKNKDIWISVCMFPLQEFSVSMHASLLSGMCERHKSAKILVQLAETCRKVIFSTAWMFHTITACSRLSGVFMAWHQALKMLTVKTGWHYRWCAVPSCIWASLMLSGVWLHEATRHITIRQCLSDRMMWL